MEAVKSAATIEVVKESFTPRFGVIFLDNEFIKLNSTLAITPISEGKSVVPLVTKFP